MLRVRLPISVYLLHSHRPPVSLLYLHLEFFYRDYNFSRSFLVTEYAVQFYETVLSIHLNLCQLCSVGEVYKDLNKMSSILRLTDHFTLRLRPAILPYCHLVWHFCKASDTRKLERIQERGLRAVFKDNSSSYNQLLARAGLPTLHNRRLQDLSILMYKVKHKLCPYYLCDFFSNNPSTYNLRQSDFTMPRFNSVKYGKHSIRYLGPKVWSKLSKGIREATSLSTFKTKIRNLNNLDALLDDGCRGCLLCSS